MKKLLTKYLKDIASTTMQGDAREESYYNSLKDLFSDFHLEKDRKTVVTVLPKPTEAGNPDFRVWDGDHFIVGYIEAKAPGTNLDQVETPLPGGNCHPSYPDFCIPPPPPDLDCKDIGRYNFTVNQPDPHNFDMDKDGIGCEK